MNILLGTQYPYANEHIWGGVQAVSENLRQGFQKYCPHDAFTLVCGSEHASNFVEKKESVVYIKKPRVKLGSIYLSTYPLRIKQWLQSYPYHVLNAHTIDFAFYGLKKNDHVIFTPHGYNWVEQRFVPWYKQPLWNKYYVKRLYTVLQQVKYLVSINPHGRAQFESKTNATIFDICNPVSDPFFQLEDEACEHRFLWMGVISEMKNLLHLLKALVVVKQHVSDFKFIFAGKIEDRSYFETVSRFIDTHDLRECVEYAGILDEQRKLEELSKIDFLVVNSVNEHAPMVIAESCAAGKPVIASNIGGIPYMVEDEKTGLLIDPVDSGDTADKIMFLLQNPKQAKKMGMRARAYAKNHHDQSLVIRQYKKAFEEVASS